MPSDQQQQPKLAASRKRRASSEGPEPAEAADLDCAICGDKATGRHYGAMSCDGCKGFFRRTIRKRHAYVCRYVKACNVDKAHRNTCRSCRYARCISSGMKPAAVQRERDRISTIVHHDTTPPPPPQTPTTSATTPSMPSPGPAMYLFPSNEFPTNNRLCSDSETIIGKLMQAESRMRQLRSSVITRTADAYRMATTVDVTESIHQQLILMVEWAKQLEQFRRLPMQAQINLLRHFSAQHLVICAAFRSLGATNDTICLTNDSSLHRDAPTIPDVNRVAARILDHLTTPMKRLAMDEKEYVALKAVAFFDPIARGVEEWSADIERTRDEVLLAFEHYATKLSPQKGMSFRLASLLLLLPPIMSIARDLAEEAQLAKIFGMADIDTLMAELMLPEDPDNNTYQHLKQVTASTALSFNPGQEIHPAPETTVPVSGGTATTLFGLTSLPIQTSAPTTGAALPMPLHLPMGPSFTSSQFFM